MNAIAGEKKTTGETTLIARATTADQLFASGVKSISQWLDRIAGFCLAAIMVLVVANIILRVIFNSPILGTIDYVGFLAALAIGLALAYCAVQNAHIAVDFVIERFPHKLQAVVDSLINTIALGFWGLVAWKMVEYAQSLAASGVVAPTTQTPFHPFVYLVALGLFVLCLILLVRLIDSIKRMTVNK